MADNFDPDQYIESFDPDQYLGQRDSEAASEQATPEQSAPTQGFDPDRYIQSFDPDAYLKGRSAPQDKPQAESELQTFGREAAHAVVPAAGGFIAGAGAGALAGSVVPGWGNLAGAVVGGLAGAFGADWAQDKALKAAGFDDTAQRQANLEANPKSAFAGQLAPAAAAMRFDRAAPIVARAVSGGLMGGIEAGQELYNEGKVSPGKVAAAGAVGAVLPTPNRVGRVLENAGQSIAARVSGRPGIVANPEAVQAKEEATGQTPATSDTIGNPQSAVERSDRVYTKGQGEAPQGDILTTGDVDPTVAAALGAEQDSIRFYHGGEDPTSGGGRWLSPQEDYAQGYADRNGAPVHYVDVPRDVAERHGGYDEVNNYPRNFEAPEEIAKQLKPLGAEDGIKAEGRPAEMPVRAKEGEKVTGEVGGGDKEPPEPPGRDTLGPPPAEPEAKATKEDLESGLWPLLTRTLGGRKGPSWLAAQKNILGKQGEAEQVRQTDIARFTNDMHKLVNETSPAEQRMLVNHMQGGDHFPTYKPSEGLKDIVSKIREGYRDFENKMREMPDFEKMEFWDNDKYLTAQYKNPEAAREYFKDFSRAGGSGSTKKRFFPTDEDARKAGLEPISTNPIERFLRYSDAMSSHLAYKQIIREGKDSGYIKYYNPHTVAGAGTPEPYVKGRPPEGWSPIDGLKNAGGAQAYAPRDYAAAMNNFLGNGLGGRSSDWRNFWGGARRIANNFTALELGIATYHAFTTVHERTGSAWSTALSQAAGGDLEKAGKTFAKSLAAPIDIKTGKRLQDLFNGVAKDGTPQEMAIIDGMKAANFKPISAKHALDYEMSKAGAYYDSIVRGSFKHEMITEWKNIIGENGWKEAMMVLPRNMGRMMQTIAKPLFEIYIPRMKTAAFAENLKAWMDANPDYKVEDMRAVAIKIGKSIDNRMGEMAQDNMLMHRTLRDAGTLALRSFSFTLGGPFREVGGGVQSLVRGALKGENRLSIKSNQYDPRTAYALAFPVAVASMSMLYQFLKTGKGPEEWRDLVYPKTGGEQPGNGRGRLVPERALLPGYHKDIMAYIFHPGQEAKNKVAGLWQAIADQMRGKKMTEVGDVPIVPPNASIGEAALARGKAFGEKALPIFVKTASQDPRLTSKISYPEQLLGFRSPGKWAADSEGQHIADDKRAQREWDFAQKRINADRASRGLDRLPPRERNPNP